MIGIVIVAHGELAGEYLAAVEHVVGPQTGIAAISCKANHDRPTKQAEICRAAQAVDSGQGVAMVADLHGGSPANLCFEACKKANRKILTGANLPMLIKLTKSRHLDLSSAIRVAKEAGRKYIDSLEPNL